MSAWSSDMSPPRFGRDAATFVRGKGRFFSHAFTATLLPQLAGAGGTTNGVFTSCAPVLGVGGVRGMRGIFGRAGLPTEMGGNW